MQLAELGIEIEKHYGLEQDIEWCLSGDQFYIVQSRPITSLYPVPPVRDGKLCVFLSFSHLQMMTDAMKPMAISLWQKFLPLGKDLGRSPDGILVEAGGRLYLDPTEFLYLKSYRRMVSKHFSQVDEMMSHAVSAFAQREDFLREVPKHGVKRKVFRLIKPMLGLYMRVFPRVIKSFALRDPQSAIQRGLAVMEDTLNQCERNLSGVAGAERIKRIQDNADHLFSYLQFALPYFASGMLTLAIVPRLIKRWLGDDRSIAALNKSLPGNVTSEMGLMIGDLADTARKYPEVIEYLQHAEDDTFYQGLGKVNGGELFKAEWDRFMKKYGMRCPGEIDISKVRWCESPIMLVSPILSHIQSNAPNEHREKFRQGEREAEEAARNILERLREKRGGYFKEKLLSRLLFVYRNTGGLRELPKYFIVRFLYLYKKAILEEARSLCEKGILQREEDVFFLSLEELIALLENRLPEHAGDLIESRKQAHEQYQKLTPPRVLTSEGEVITGVRSNAQALPDALLGTPVSAGVAEGYVKVVLHPGEGKLKKGDILVAPFTDPGWTPLFHSAKALVTEVGGLMTHGSVVAREYGIPAVVGVDNATKTLKDGQYVRIDGSRGFVQILNEKGKQP